MSAPRELVKGNAQVLILSCLAREDMHGYRIAKELEQLSEGYFMMREGTLYPHLHELEKEGHIEGYWETANGGRERKMYRITDSGKAELAKKKQALEKFNRNLNKILGLGLNPDSASAFGVA